MTRFYLTKYLKTPISVVHRVMQETNMPSVQKEIQSNMAVVSRQQPYGNNEELENLQNNTQTWGNSRNSRKNNNSSSNNNTFNKGEQTNAPCDRVNLPYCENIKHNTDMTRTTQSWLESINVRVKSAEAQHNKPCLDNLETMRENMRNSQESIKRTNSVNIMDLEQSMRASQQSLLTADNNLMCSTSSLESMARSTDDLDSSLRASQSKDAHTAAIDLSNNCRKFYFKHMKTAEAIKQSIRTSRHTRARDKMEGKQPSKLDNAMHRLRAEMADLMDQDLSLMSQLLKLNDKIEDIKATASQQTYRPNYTSSTDMSDSEMSDYEDSRFDLTKSVNSPHGYVSAVRQQAGQPEVQLRRVDSSTKDVIVYRKRSPRTKKAKTAKSSSDTEDDTATEDNDEFDDEDDDDTDGVFTSDDEHKTGEHSDTEDGDEAEEESHSDGGSTISNKSTASKTSGTDTERRESDSGIHSPTPKPPEEPPKPVKGGVSRNTSFLDFHKNNGTVRSAKGFNPNLMFQGHNVNAEKYYVPQGLVYLKHTKDENVFCQFSH